MEASNVSAMEIEDTQQEIAFSLYDEIRSSSVNISMKTPMKAEQEILYNAVLSIQSGSFIAGGFPSYNALWKEKFSDVDIYVPVYGDIRRFEKTVDVFIGTLYKKICLMVPSIARETQLYNFAYEHDNCGIIRLQIKKMKVDIVLRWIPTPNKVLDEEDKRIYGILYVLSGFDNMFCRVAIMDYNPITSTMIVLGSHEAAAAEARMKVYVIRECQRILEEKVKFITQRLRNPDLRVWRTYQRSLAKAYNRILKYLSTNDRPPTDYLPARSLLICLPYGINHDLKRVLPSCLWFLENEVEKTHALSNLLLDYQMAINFPGADEVVDEERLPRFPKKKRCSVCRYLQN